MNQESKIPPFKTFESVSCQDFIKEISEIGDTPIQKIHEIVKYCVPQYAFWHVKWLFSPSVSPDINAKNESELWDKLMNNLIKALEEKTKEKEYGKLMDDTKRLTVISYASQWNIEYYKTRPIQRRLNGLIGFLSFLTSKIGLKNQSNWLKMRQLFPSWTAAGAE